MERVIALRTGLAPIGRFVLHGIEMCLAMCIGAIGLNVLIWGGAALLGFADLTQRFPVSSALVITATLSLPMAAWMRFRGHDWRHTIEMSGATVVVGLLIVGAFWFGVVAKSNLIEWQLSLACPVMFAMMLLRFPFYSRGHAAHHAEHAAHDAHGAHV